jgi:hypothetical protein
MKRRRFKQTTTLEERLAERARQVREDLEKVPPPGEESGRLNSKNSRD